MAGSTSAAIADDLFSFIKRTSAQRFDWVSCNCGFWVCEWVKVARGIDPVGYLRSKFEIPEEFKRHVARRGGNEEFSRMIAENAGLVETANPKRGDVGLVVHGQEQMMAIYLGDGRWAAKSAKGVAIAEWPMITAWRV